MKECEQFGNHCGNFFFLQTVKVQSFFRVFRFGGNRERHRRQQLQAILSSTVGTGPMTCQGGLLQWTSLHSQHSPAISLEAVTDRQLLDDRRRPSSDVDQSAPSPRAAIRVSLMTDVPLVMSPATVTNLYFVLHSDVCPFCTGCRRAKIRLPSCCPPSRTSSTGLAAAALSSSLFRSAH